MKMGSSFKKAIFDEHVQVGLVGWAQKVKRKKGLKAAVDGSGSGSGSGSGAAPQSSHDGSTSATSSSMGIQLGRLANKAKSEQTDGSKWPEFFPLLMTCLSFEWLFRKFMSYINVFM